MEKKFNIEQIELVYQECLEEFSDVDLTTCHQIACNIPEDFSKNINKILDDYFKTSNDINKLYFKIFWFQLIGLTQKQFCEYLKNINKMETIKSDNEIYSRVFKSYSEEVKNRIINLFNIYKNIVLENGDLKKIRDLCAAYKMLLTYLVCFIPTESRKQLLSLNNSKLKDHEIEDGFSKINDVLEKFEYIKVLEGYDFAKFYIYKIEKFICDKIEADFGVNLFDYEMHSESRKRV